MRVGSAFRCVGGYIFYIDDTATGIYTFKNGSGETVSAPSLHDNCTDWTYTVSGGNDKDKYYVAYNNLYTNLTWGAVDTAIGIYDDGIGVGRSNTNAAIGSAADITGSIWELIRTMRANNTGGCDDWYIGSKLEMQQIWNHYSDQFPMSNWFVGRDIWTSVEADADKACLWSNMTCKFMNWSKNGEGNLLSIPCAIAIRSF